MGLFPAMPVDAGSEDPIEAKFPDGSVGVVPAMTWGQLAMTWRRPLFAGEHTATHNRIKVAQRTDRVLLLSVA